MSVTFFDILGIDRSLSDEARRQRATDIWPADKVHFLTGVLLSPASVSPLMEYLQNTLVFRSVSPGSTPGTAGLYAEIEIKNPPGEPLPLVIHTLQDMAFFLQDTGDGRPARCYITQTDNGTEIILEALPVEIRLPWGLLEPLTQTEGEEPPAPLTNPFVAGIYDSYAVQLRSPEPSSIFVHTRIRMTEEMDFIIEPSVVISVGPCLFSGLPCFGLHDISFLPSPTLNGDHESVEQALEWTRHTIDPAASLLSGDPEYRGVLVIRTIDLDSRLSPLKELNEWLNSGQPQADQIQFVLQDVVLPSFYMLILPVPVHATLGIRRNIEFGDRFEEAYSFAGAPVKIELAGFLLLIEEFLIETVDPDAVEEARIAKVNIAITRGEVPKITTVVAAIGAADTTITVNDPSVFADAEFPLVLVIDRTNPAAKEIVTANSIHNNQLQVVRGQHETTAIAHASGATIETDRFAENAVTIGFTDEWTAQAGWRRNKGIPLFTLGDNRVKLMGAKVGFSFRRLYEHNHGTASYSTKEFFQVLVDLNLEVKPSDSKKFRIEILSASFQASAEPVNIIWKDIGYNLGSPALGGVQLPEGTQIVLLDFLKIILQSIAVQTDKNGGTYFAISGGLGVSSEKYAAAIIVHNFRWRIAGNENAAEWLLDGISFFLKIKSFELSGTGMAGEFRLNDHLYKEMQFGLTLKFRALDKNFELGLFLYKGEVSGPADNFKYWMFGFKLGFLPVSGFDLYNIRMLAANNLAPDLAPPDTSEQHLRVYKWYKNATAPLTVSTDRKLNAWIPREDSFAFGAGTAGTVSGTKAILLDMFVFGHHSPTENAFMVAMEVYLLKSQKPVGFGVLEVDLERGQWAFVVGVSLSFSNVLPEGASVPGLDNVAALSGNLYIGNQPGTFALGQLSDQNTWLAFRMKEDRFFKMELVLGICIQFIDKAEGPKGFGALVSAKGGVSFGVGKAEFYLNFLLIAGIWKNESSASGLIIVFEAGFRIKLFRVFRFGASIKVQLDFLGPNPEYKRLAFEIHIDTPWYLPDVTIRFEKIYDTPKPERQLLVSIPIISAEAFVAGIKQAGPVLLTPLEGATLDEKQLYHMDRLRSLSAPDIDQAMLDNMTAVGVDSTIVFNFKPPVDDKLTIGEVTPAGAGTQEAVAPASSELRITYQLVSLSIRRQPRYGPYAHVWTTLLAPENTQLPALEEWPSGTELEALFSSAIKVLWDRDVQSQGRFDPRRLLINAETPFTLLTQNAEADEGLLVFQPGWPCCPDGGKQLWHQVNFTGIASGQRVPGSQVFSDSNSMLHWLFGLKPLVGPSVIATAHPHAAKINLNTEQEGSFAVISFDQPAFHFRIEWYWLAQRRNVVVVLEGYNGLDLISRQMFPLSAAQSGLAEMKDARGFTGALLRCMPDQTTNAPAIARAAVALPKTTAVEIVRLEYITVLEQSDFLADLQKCQGSGQSVISGRGALAWLPHHNYEITATTKVMLQHHSSGVQEASMVQRAYFRTKGMIGLNYVEYTGKEIEPYLEATYPTASDPLIYREEPVAIAFTEQFNILLPVNRNIDPANPAELNQLLEWDLTVDKEGDAFGRNRISKSNPDWIVSNRGTGTTPPFDHTILVNGVLASLIRKAPSTNVMRQRMLNILASPHSCNAATPPAPPSSQVLLHKPVDPSVATPPALWESNTAFRASLKIKDGPCIYRNPFDADDVTAFKPFSEHGTEAHTWIFENGGVAIPATGAADIRHYAVFGDTGWDHVKTIVQVNPGGSIAGFAIGITTGASGITQALLAVIDEGSGQVKAQCWSNGSLQELQQAAIPVGLSAPYQLQLVAYDDQLEIKLDDAVLLIERGAIRAGQLALVAKPGGSFSRLTVESLDAFHFSFQSSRFISFEQHIQSAGDYIRLVPAAEEATQLISTLYAGTSAFVDQLMQPDADRALRADLFMQWADALALPLLQQPQELCISRLQKDNNTHLLLMESPEPLRFSKELQLDIRKEITEPVQPVLPGVGNLEAAIPAGLMSYQQQLPPLIKGVRTLRITAQTVSFSITNSALNTLPQRPRYALTALSDEGRVKYFVFEIRFGLRNSIYTQVIATLKHSDSFSSSFFPRAFIQQLTRHIRKIHVDEVYLLADTAALIRIFTLPGLSSPFTATQHFRVLSNGDETSAILIPLTAAGGEPAPWTGGKYEFQFTLHRTRYAQQPADDNATYIREVNLPFTW